MGLVESGVCNLNTRIGMNGNFSCDCNQKGRNDVGNIRTVIFSHVKSICVLTRTPYG
jgi:hypothetical protein